MHGPVRECAHLHTCPCTRPHPTPSTEQTAHLLSARSQARRASQHPAARLLPPGPAASPVTPAASTKMRSAFPTSGFSTDPGEPWFGEGHRGPKPQNYSERNKTDQESGQPFSLPPNTHTRARVCAHTALSLALLFPTGTAALPVPTASAAWGPDTGTH